MANNLKFTISAVDRTKQAFSGIKKGLGAVTKGLFNFKTAIAGVVGVGGIGLLVKNSLQATDRIGKLSGVLGISVKDLQTFKLASEIGGIELETFAKGVRRFTDNIGDFADGVGEAKVTFEKLGITQQDILPIQNDQVALLGLVADRLNQVEDGAIKTKFAIEIFGGRGAELINVLDGGTDALKEFSLESQRFGSLSSRQVQAVEGFNDSVVRLKTAFSGIVNQIVANLSPALQSFSDFLREKLIKSFGETEDASIKFAKKFASAVLDAIEKGARGLLAFANTIVGTFNTLFNQINRIPDILLKDIKLLKEFELPKGFLEALDSARESLEDIGKDTEKIGSGIDDVDKNSGKAKKTFQGIKLDIGIIADKLLTKTNDQFSKINDVIATGIMNGVKSISNSLAEAVVLGKKLEDTFKNIAQRLLVSIISKLIEEKLLKIANLALDTLKESILGRQEKKEQANLSLQKKKNKELKTEIALRTILALFGGGGGGGFSIPFLANGGRLNAGQPAVVGERGKELFIPDSSGTVVPNNKLNSFGSVTNVNFNISTVDARGFDELLVSRRGTISRIINESVNERGREAII